MDSKSRRIGFSAILFSFVNSSFADEHQIQTYKLRTSSGSFPALFVSADGEGCCNFTAEMTGTFSLNHDLATNAVWIDEAEVILHSAVTWRLGMPITDPTDRLFKFGPDWLNGVSLFERIPGILSRTPGQAEGDDRFNFGPHFTNDHTYLWDYSIQLSDQGGRLFGESRFWGDDGAIFFIDVPLLVVPEPPAKYQFLIVAFAVAGFLFQRVDSGNTLWHE